MTGSLPPQNPVGVEGVHDPQDGLDGLVLLAQVQDQPPHIDAVGPEIRRQALSVKLFDGSLGDDTAPCRCREGRVDTRSGKGVVGGIQQIAGEDDVVLDGLLGAHRPSRSRRHERPGEGDRGPQPQVLRGLMCFGHDDRTLFTSDVGTSGPAEALEPVATPDATKVTCGDLCATIRHSTVSPLLRSLPGEPVARSRRAWRRQ
jgi:hypothetical protein